jgi:hypothetical protein
VNSLIVSAIQNRRVLELHYHGYSRLAEPHLYGQTEDNRDRLLCWQIGGGSQASKPTGWKLLFLDEAHRISSTERSFERARPGYTGSEQGYRRVFAKL